MIDSPGAGSRPLLSMFNTEGVNYMNTVHNDKPTREAYRETIVRMVKNIGDKKTLAMIYRYILYLYTGNHQGYGNQAHDRECHEKVHRLGC